MCKCYHTFTSCSLNVLSRFPASLPKPRILQEVEVPIVAIGECKNIYASVPDNTICAGSAGTGICYVSVQNTSKHISMGQGAEMSQTRSQLVHQD